MSELDKAYKEYMGSYINNTVELRDFKTIYNMGLERAAQVCENHSALNSACATIAAEYLAKQIRSIIKDNNEPV